MQLVMGQLLYSQRGFGGLTHDYTSSQENLAIMALEPRKSRVGKDCTKGSGKTWCQTSQADFHRIRIENSLEHDGEEIEKRIKVHAC